MDRLFCFCSCILYVFVALFSLFAMLGSQKFQVSEDKCFHKIPWQMNMYSWFQIYIWTIILPSGIMGIFLFFATMFDNEKIRLIFLRPIFSLFLLCFIGQQILAIYGMVILSNPSSGKCLQDIPSLYRLCFASIVTHCLLFVPTCAWILYFSFVIFNPNPRTENYQQVEENATQV